MTFDPTVSLADQLNAYETEVIVAPMPQVDCWPYSAVAYIACGDVRCPPKNLDERNQMRRCDGIHVSLIGVALL